MKRHVSWEQRASREKVAKMELEMCKKASSSLSTADISLHSHQSPMPPYSCHVDLFRVACHDELAVQQSNSCPHCVRIIVVVTENFL